MIERFQLQQFNKLQPKGEGMKNKLINVAPKVIRLGIKALKMAKGGFTNDELRELGTDLLELGLEILDNLD